LPAGGFKMTLHTKIAGLQSSVLLAATDSAARAIPPVWPLASSVAVNPYLGQAHETLAAVGARLGRVAGLPVTMPREWYAARIASGKISDADLIGALEGTPQNSRPSSLADLKAAAPKPNSTLKPLSTIADLAAEVSGVDWPGVIAERFGAFAASWFDSGQALWVAPQAKSAFAAWREIATHDLTPEILGLSGFARHVVDAPDAASDALARAIDQLGLNETSLPTYLHHLLMTLGGWSQYARYKLWQAELGASTDATLTDFLTIRLVWEEALLANYGGQIAEAWEATKIAHAEPIVATPDLIIDQILQEAAERAEQRVLAATLKETSSKAANARPALQAAFCIDVRSEVFRRALETVDPNIQTIGFAGFFGLTASHKRFASDVPELRLPVLLNPGVFTCSGGPIDEKADQEARFSARAKRAWGRFKLAAVSSFAFVEAMGPVYAAKLVRDSFGQAETPLPNDPAPRLNPALDLPSRLAAAETVLRAMSMTGPFARIILMTGHGANVVNNPHASALHCGACGGYSGEVNARLLAALLNDVEVRSGLIGKGIDIPADTLFLGALHDTTTDAVHIYAADHPSLNHAEDLRQARAWLTAAGTITRTERALKLPRANNETKIAARSSDWSEVRPEWALAGCKAFIAAPRNRTKGKNLHGRAFLHDYDWQQDSKFGVLELIMTAPVVVASWISLQYYGSTVAPQFFGSGNKLLHNVAGGVGVVEGNGGPLRAGLPWQSVHDGENYIHDPLRLSVCIEAPRDAMNDILARHDNVRALFDNRWLHLFAMDENGHLAFRYCGNLEWQAV
jgi:uncharacterized protein